MTLRSDKPVSEAQRRAMWSAASGNSTLGIPKSVGKEFAEADPGGKLPERKRDDAETGKGHLHLSATPITSSKPAFRMQAASHEHVEQALKSLHSHIQKHSLPTHNVSIENKHTGEVHSAKVSPEIGVYKNSWGSMKSGVFDARDDVKNRGDALAPPIAPQQWAAYRGVQTGMPPTLDDCADRLDALTKRFDEFCERTDFGARPDDFFGTYGSYGDSMRSDAYGIRQRAGDHGFHPHTEGSRNYTMKHPNGETLAASRETDRWHHKSPKGSTLGRGEGHVELGSHLTKWQNSKSYPRPDDASMSFPAKRTRHARALPKPKADDALKPGDRVRVTGGMKEFHGSTGTASHREGGPGQWRVHLDEPVHVKGVGHVGNDLWHHSGLKKLPSSGGGRQREVPRGREDARQYGAAGRYGGRNDDDISASGARKAAETLERRGDPFRKDATRDDRIPHFPARRRDDGGRWTPPAKRDDAALPRVRQAAVYEQFKDDRVVEETLVRDRRRDGAR